MPDPVRHDRKVEINATVYIPFGVVKSKEDLSVMTVQKKEKSQDKGNRKKKPEPEVPLPFCTTAADPEHERGYAEEEPCDDGRSGKIASTEDQKEATEEKGATHYPHDD
jgi:hypothetical protein